MARAQGLSIGTVESGVAVIPWGPRAEYVGTGTATTAKIVVVEARHSARGGSHQALGQPEVARCKIEVRRSVSGGAVCMTRDR